MAVGNSSFFSLQNSSVATYALTIYEITALLSGAQTLNMGTTITSIDSLYINGLRQSPGQVTISGTLALIPAGLSIVAGDLITLIFS